MTKPCDRDIDRLLKSARLQPAGAPAGPCLDAETLAAWADGTLTTAQHALAEHHAADCARCQAMLAAMARTAPSDPAPATGWAPWRVARWAVPLSAAAAVALWFAVDPEVAQRQQTEPALSAPSQSDAPQSSSAPAGAPPSASQVPTRTARPSADSPSAGSASRRADAAKPSPPVARDVREEAPARSDLRDLAAYKDEPTQRARTAPPAAPTPAAEAERETPPKMMAKAPPPPAASPAPPTVAETVVPSQASQQADAQAPGPSQKRLAQQVAQSVARATWIDVASPDPLVKWRFAPGVVEQSTDGGITWTRQAVGSPAFIVAGAAPSSAACWLVGSGGLVLRFTTARGWQRLAIPTAPDVVAVDAKDADNATVVLANGTRLTTTDGGATWR